MQSELSASPKSDFATGGISEKRRSLARAFLAVFTGALVVIVALQIAHSAKWIDTGFADWRPVALAVLLWFIAVDIGVVLLKGARGERALFLLPAVELTL